MKTILNCTSLRLVLVLASLGLAACAGEEATAAEGEAVAAVAEASGGSLRIDAPLAHDLNQQPAESLRIDAPLAHDPTEPAGDSLRIDAPLAYDLTQPAGKSLRVDAPLAHGLKKPSSDPHGGSEPSALQVDAPLAHDLNVGTTARPGESIFVAGPIAAPPSVALPPETIQQLGLPGEVPQPDPSSAE